MALDLVEYPATLAAQADFTAHGSLIELRFTDRVYIPQWVVSGSIPQGVALQIGGAVYQGTTDTAIVGTASDYVQVTASGATANPVYVPNLSGVAWSKIYNGYYDGTGRLYLFDEGKALVNGAISTVFGRYLAQQPNGDVAIGSALTVKNNATVGGTLGITGATTVGGTLGVTGNATLSSELTVGGSTTISGELAVAGKVAGNGYITLPIRSHPVGTDTNDTIMKAVTNDLILTVVQIGAWNINTGSHQKVLATNAEITGGTSLFGSGFHPNKIRAWSSIIIDDSGNLSDYNSGIEWYFIPANGMLVRGGTIYRNVLYDSTAINRGYLSFWWIG